jgi:hypothetical protein
MEPGRIAIRWDKKRLYSRRRANLKRGREVRNITLRMHISSNLLQPATQHVDVRFMGTQLQLQLLHCSFTTCLLNKGVADCSESR